MPARRTPAWPALETWIDVAFQASFQSSRDLPQPGRYSSRTTARLPADMLSSLSPAFQCPSQRISQRLSSIRSLATDAARAFFSHSRPFCRAAG